MDAQPRFCFPVLCHKISSHTNGGRALSGYKGNTIDSRFRRKAEVNASLHRNGEVRLFEFLRNPETAVVGIGNTGLKIRAVSNRHGAINTDIRNHCYRAK